MGWDVTGPRGFKTQYKGYGKSMSNQLPSNEQAQESAVFMAQEIHAPAFFEKLSAYGLQPNTEAEAAQMLQLGAVLQTAEQEGNYKTAADIANETGNPFLDYALHNATGGSVQKQAASGSSNDEQLAAAAAAVAQTNPVAKQAALTYAHMLAGGEIAES